MNNNCCPQTLKSINVFAPQSLPMLKFLFATLLFYTAPAGGHPNPVANQSLTVTITRLENNNGSVLVSLFREGAGFPDDASRATGKMKVSIANNSARAVFTNIPPGQYAVAILHDENNNQKMDKNFLGLPKEGYGFSNNASAPFGPPSFRKASFTHTALRPTEISIKTKYL